MGTGSISFGLNFANFVTLYGSGELHPGVTPLALSPSLKMQDASPGLRNALGLRWTLFRYGDWWPYLATELVYTHKNKTVYASPYASEQDGTGHEVRVTGTALGGSVGLGVRYRIQQTNEYPKVFLVMGGRVDMLPWHYEVSVERPFSDDDAPSSADATADANRAKDVYGNAGPSVSAGLILLLQIEI